MTNQELRRRLDAISDALQEVTIEVNELETDWPMAANVSALLENVQRLIEFTKPT